MNTMNVTVDLNAGEQAVFTIEFKNEDFMAVVDAIDGLTMISIHNNPLWTVQL